MIFLIQYPFSSNYNVNEIDISNELNYVTLKDNLKSMSNEIFNNFDLTSELHLIKYKDFGTIFTLKAYEKIHGIAICHTKSIREDNRKRFADKISYYK